MAPQPAPMPTADVDQRQRTVDQLVGLNVARYVRGIPLRAFTTILGIAALAAGLSLLAGLAIPLFPLCLVLIGIGLILEAFLRPAA